MSARVVLMTTDGHATCEDKCPFVCSKCAARTHSQFEDLDEDLGAIYGQPHPDDEEVYAQWRAASMSGSSSTAMTTTTTSYKPTNEYIKAGVICDAPRLEYKKVIKLKKGEIVHG